MYANVNQTIISRVFQNPPHQEILIAKRIIPHPITLGYRLSLGAPVGQDADYRLALKDGKSIHVHEYAHTWGFHWDRVDPSTNLFEHLRQDSPEFYVLACTSVGAGFGAVLGASTKKRNAIVPLSVIFGLLGLAYSLAKLNEK